MGTLRTKGEKKIAELEGRVEYLEQRLEDASEREKELRTKLEQREAQILDLRASLNDASETSAALFEQNELLIAQKESDKEALKNTDDILRKRIHLAETRSNEFEKTSIIFAILFLNSGEKDSLREKLTLFDDTRKIASFSLEDLGSSYTRTINKAFSIITPFIFKVIEEENIDASERTLLVRAVPEKVQELTEALAELGYTTEK